MAESCKGIDQMDVSESDKKIDNTRRAKIILICLIAGILLVAVIGVALILSKGSKGPLPTPTPQSGCTNYKPRTFSKDFMRNVAPSNISWHQKDCPRMQNQKCPAGFTKPPLLLIMLNGFRPDYLQRGHTPAIKKLADCGVHARFMRPSYPSVTFPNAYSIVTGLYPESHGIVSNSMYDTDLKMRFSLSSKNKLDSRWWGGEPIWNSVQKNGKRSFVFYWPGSDVPIQGQYPDVCYNFNKSTQFTDRVRQVLSWLELEEDKRPHFMALYLSEPDYTVHREGPKDDKVNTILQSTDRAIGDLMTGIINRNLQNCINIMLVSDHGMSPTSCSRVINLPHYGIDTSNYLIYDRVNARISGRYRQKDGVVVPREHIDAPENIVKKLECKSTYMDVFKKEDLPKRFHYSKNKRIEEVVLDVTPGWLVSRTNSSYRCNGGNHGYDNKADDMKALFVAHGPSFKQQLVVDPFENIELYNLMAELLALEDPALNNGTKGSLSHILKNPTQYQQPSPVTQYVECAFPTRTAWRRRFNQSGCLYNTLPALNQSVWELDQHLKLTKSQIEEAVKRHLPLGVPQIKFTGSSVCMLTQYEYITGFDRILRAPIWTAFTLYREAGKSFQGQSRLDGEFPGCIRTDVRLGYDSITNYPIHKETRKNVSHGFFFHPGFSTDPLNLTDSLISSNVMPMFTSFSKGIWREAMLLLEEYNKKYGPIQVITGPIYDFNADGHKDDAAEIARFAPDGSIPLPTHFYLVVSRCTDGGKPRKCSAHTDSLAIILPHKPTISNCKKPRDFLEDNVARIRDVELLTGLLFYPDLPMQDRVRHKTHLAVSLWKNMSWMEEKQCIGQSEAQPSCPWSGTPPLLLISLDGFNPTYLQRNRTPNIQRLSQCGVHTQYMQPVFPTLTFPSHYSIATGLYPESHGIIDNFMYDMKMRKQFSLFTSQLSDPSWWLGEPFWNTVTKQNKSSMTFFWPGSDIAIQGRRPTRYMKYNSRYPNKKRVEKVLGWLDGSAGVRPDFMTLYFSPVDKAGHDAGPNSITLNESLAEVDSYIGLMMDGLYRRGIHNCVNIIILADHGMTDISCDRQVLLKDYISISNIHSFSGGIGRISNLYKAVGRDIVHIHPKNRTKIEDIMKNLTCVSPNMRPFQKAHLPKRYHYAASHRIEPIVLDMKEHWMVGSDAPYLCFLKGMHAWDPFLESMWALFLAHGPSLKSKHRVEPFESIEVYNLLADLVNVTAAPNNGTRGRLYDLLRKPPPLPTPTGSNYSTCVFPGSDAEYQDRRNRICCCVNGTEPKRDYIRKWDNQLHFTKEEQKRLEHVHLPHGLPFNFLSHSPCILHHQDFVSAYSSVLKLPLWTAYTLTAKVTASAHIESGMGCSRPDVRVSPSRQNSCCDFQLEEKDNITGTPVFPRGFSSNTTTMTDVSINTNFIPMLNGFRTGIWQYLISKVKTWTNQYGYLHLVSGPIFDYNYDGVADSVEDIQSFKNERLNMSVPTHFYMVVIRCPPTDTYRCADMGFSVQSFILPHLANITNCMNEDAYLVHNLARIRDIELLTGMQLLTANNTQTAIVTRTFISGKLWPVPLP